MFRIAARARAFGVSAGLAVASLGVVAPIAASADGGSTTWNVQVGAGDNVATGTNRFYPSDITVHPGDVVEFDWGGFHTVTFNPVPAPVFAYIGPGALTGSTTLDSPTTFVNGTPAFAPPPAPPPAPFRLTIGANLPTGVYHYWCQLHQYMHGVIRVKNGELPRTNTENQALAQQQIASDLTEAARIDARLSRGSEEDGALVGFGNRVVEMVKYYPSSITVRAGEQITFKDADPGDPHSVTFGYATANPPLAPPGEIFASAPSPATYGGGDLNSGYLMSQSQFNYWHLAGALPGFTPQKEYAITFTKPGTYGFYCTIHGGILPDGTVVGMSGHVIVLPAEADSSGTGD